MDHAGPLGDEKDCCGRYRRRMGGTGEYLSDCGVGRK